jgi:hypothetical protein
MNEIKFLRDLKVCENVVALDRVYCQRKSATGALTLSMVMNFAKYGSLL